MTRVVPSPRRERAMRLRHSERATSGASAVPASKPAPSRSARLAATLRTRWWPRFLLVGALLAVVGVTLLSGMAQDVTVPLGVLIFLVAALQAAGADNRTPTDLQRSRFGVTTLLKASSIGSRRESAPPPD
jgi:hypothetical protein